MANVINYKKIGGDYAVKSGNQLKYSAHFTGEGAPEDAWLKKIISFNKVRLVSADGAHEEVMEIVKASEIDEGKCFLKVTVGSKKIYGIDTYDVDNPEGPYSATDGDYEEDAIGGDAITPARIEFTLLAGEVTGSVITDPGEYNDQPSTLTFSIDNGGDTITVTNIVWEEVDEVDVDESAKKLAQHRVYTFEGGAYKYDIETPSEGDAEVESA